MAKYSRFDSRNKKRGKHKQESLNKDHRIREITDSKKPLLREITYDDDWTNSYIEESVGRNRQLS